MLILAVEGEKVPIGADWSIRFVDNPVTPVLYYQGKRVTKRWAMLFDIALPADPHGENGNTADLPSTNRG